MMSQMTEGGASVLMAFLQAWERETLCWACKRADLRERERRRRRRRADKG